MEKWQCDHIQQNIQKLVELTSCDHKFLLNFYEKGLLNSEEVTFLNTIANPSEKCSTFYKLIQRKTKSYELLKEVLEDVKLTGALKVLEQVKTQNVTAPFRNFGTISYDKTKLLGRGSYNTKVYKGKFENREVAVKIFNVEDGEMNMASKEIDILSHLDYHENIVRYFKTEIADDVILIAMELCDMNLDQFVKIPELCDAAVLNCIRQITKGLKFLHSKQIIHRDLKPANILISCPGGANLRVKLSDFGLSQNLPDGMSRIKSDVAGTPGWMAPEVIRQSDNETNPKGMFYVRQAADIFSLGCVYYFVLTRGRHPFGHGLRRDLNILSGQSTLNADLIRLQEKFRAEAFVWLISQMISEKEGERPKTHNIPDHPAFWNTNKMFVFYEDIYPYIDNIRLDDYVGNATCFTDNWNWVYTLDNPLKVYLVSTGTVDGTKSSHLIKVIVEMYKNYTKLPQDVQQLLSNSREKYFCFWGNRFPFLFVLIWTVCQFKKWLTSKLTTYYPINATDFVYNILGSKQMGLLSYVDNETLKQNINMEPLINLFKTVESSFSLRETYHRHSPAKKIKMEVSSLPKLITVEALGRTARLGSLYDAKRNEFCHRTIFEVGIPTEAITTFECSSSDICLVKSDSYSEKFAKFGLDGELQMSVLANLCDLRGSGEFLRDKSRSSKSVKNTLLYKIGTFQQFLNMDHETLNSKAFSVKAIKEAKAATHFVSGILWGARCIVSSTCSNTEGKSRAEIKKEIGANLLSIEADIKETESSGSLVFVEQNKDILQNFYNHESSKVKATTHFEIQVFGDILLDRKVPMTIEEARELMVKMPLLLKNKNDGKGIPLTYTLLPISVLKQKLELDNNQTIVTFEETIIRRIVKIFDELEESKKTIYDELEDLRGYDDFIPNNSLLGLETFKYEVERSERTLRSRLQILVPAIRSGEKQSSEIEDVILDSKTSFVTIASKLNKLTAPIWSKIRVVKTLRENAVTYIRKGMTLEAEMTQDDMKNGRSYVLYFRDDFRKQDLELFLSEKQNNVQDMFYAVDCDIHQDQNYLDEERNSRIAVKDMRQTVITNDLLFDAEYRKKEGISFAQAKHEKIIRLQDYSKLNKMGLFKLQCPGVCCDQNKRQKWSCWTCGEKLKYESRFVYCLCGKTLVKNLRYLCADAKHGNCFTKHKDSFITEFVKSNQRPPNSPNADIAIIAAAVGMLFLVGALIRR